MIEAIEGGKRQHQWYCELLRRALEQTDDVGEAYIAAELAFSLQPWSEAEFGMVGDEWHGPTAPGPGWVETGKGTRGGKIWKKTQQGGTQQSQQPTGSKYDRHQMNKLIAGKKHLETVLNSYKDKFSKGQGTEQDLEESKKFSEQVKGTKAQIVEMQKERFQSQPPPRNLKESLERMNQAVEDYIDYYGENTFKQNQEDQKNHIQKALNTKQKGVPVGFAYDELEDLRKNNPDAFQNLIQTTYRLRKVARDFFGMDLGQPQRDGPVFVSPFVPKRDESSLSLEDAELSTPLSLQPLPTLPTQTAYGTEPPGPGWQSVGPMKWTKEGTIGSPRIAIVGGGPAGLFTAHEINQRLPEAAVTIFEASDRLGGKIETCHIGGLPFEAGVAELYEYKGSRDPLRKLIEDDLGLATRNMSGGGVVLCDKVLRDLNDLEIHFGPRTRQNVEKFHKTVAKLMPLEKYTQRWQPDNDHPWADRTLRECIEAELKDDDAAIEYVETAMASDLATESYTCNGLNGIKNILLDNDKYMQLYHIVGGIERLTVALVSRLRAEVKLNTSVISVCRSDLDAAFGLVGDEWHGPTAPGPGWVETGKGARGGKIWKKQGGQAGAQQPITSSIEKTGESAVSVSTPVPQPTASDDYQIAESVQKNPLLRQQVGTGTNTGKSSELHVFSDELETEIEGAMENYEYEDEKPTRQTIIKELIQDMDDKDRPAYDFRKELQDYGIKIGVFSPITQEEMDRTVVSGRGKKYDFKKGSKFYVFSTWAPLTGENEAAKAKLSLEGEDNKYRLKYHCHGQDREELFDYVILAMPNHWLTQLRFPEPELHDAVRAFLAHYDLPAHYLRVTFLFDKRWWERCGFPGDFWMMDLCNGCCVYDESKRFERQGDKAHVLSFLIAGQDALLLCAANQTTEDIGCYILERLPSDLRAEARASVMECRVDRFVGSVCAQPGGFPVKELEGQHQLAPETHPGLFLVCDALFDSTLNGALISANTAVELLLENVEKTTKAV